MVADVWPGPRSGDPEILAADGTSLLFAATEPSTGRELWRLDLATVAAVGGGAAPVALGPREQKRDSRDRRDNRDNRN